MFRRNKKQSLNNKRRHLITQLNPRSPISEQYRSIRTNLQFSAVDESLQTIIVTSPGPAAGKSITAANLAVVYAQQEKKTLLIDGDMRKPTVHYTFRLDNLFGLSSILIGDSTLEKAVESSAVSNLDVLTCGPIPPNPSELLGSKKMADLLTQAKQLYDMIIIDTPPTLAVTDAKILANIVDGTLFVVRSGQTLKEDVTKAYEMMEDASAKVLGAVLNDVPKNNASYYYYYGN